ncbi:MAG: hypothetical protein M3Q56_02070 [Bacteroidota bacterium]|nr:hypothetical protein [Bacteroidota bacterium]
MKYTYTFLSIILLISIQLQAQNLDFSPLSRFGLGGFNKSGSSFSNHLAYGGLAYHAENQFNPNNPASLAFLKITVADIGLQIKSSNFSDVNNLKASSWSGNLSHIFIGIPLRNSINQILDRKTYKNFYSLSFGLSPYTSTAYRFYVQDSTGELGKISRDLSGAGGLNKLSGGFAYRYEDISFGINMAYVFGKQRFQQKMFFNDLIGAGDNFLDDDFTAAGFAWNLGFMYQLTLNQKLIEKDKSLRPRSITFGATIQLPSSITYTQNALYVTRIDIATNSAIDTVFYASNLKEDTEIPFGYGMGVHYNFKERFGLLADFKQEFWANSKLHSGLKGTLGDLSQYSLSGWYRPDATGFKSFFKRATYRAGFYFDSDYRVIDGKNPESFGLTLGLGMPIVFQRQTAMAHFGIDLGRTSLKNVLDENYIKFNIGFSLNDNEWFLKRRYD